jgi:peptidoglycan/xylan/chitin deacetylase (PgdA/CDA1 family)
MNWIKRLLLCFCIPLVIAVAVWFAVPVRGIPILAYHHIGNSSEWYYINAADFERQIALLAVSGYTPIGVKEMREELAGLQPRPLKPIVITFDDGYEDNWATAVPILEKYGFKATFFIVTGKVGDAGYMTWQEIQAMQTKGMEIGSHTVNHYPINEISLHEFTRELLLSRIMLENNLFCPVEIFAYPFGEVTPEMVEQLRQTGYKAACSSIIGGNFSDVNPYLLKRVTIRKNAVGLELLDFCARVLWLNITSLL